MKVVILSGGMGTRLREETEFRPKPMVEIGGKPILWHIMKIYASQGFNDFIICTGYKNEVIKNYFLNYKSIENDFTVNLKSGAITIYNTENDLDWNVTVVDTGQATQTGGRLKRIRKYLEDTNVFMVTYGDGVADINIQKLLQRHQEAGKLATLTSIFSKSKFGEIEINEQNIVTSFEEKSKTSWINGGFFVFHEEVFNDIAGDDDTLEAGALVWLAASRQLAVYKHTGFWGCMDDYKEVTALNKLWDMGRAPWKTW